MAASSRGALAIRGLLRTSSPRLCRQCATTGLQIRAPKSWRAYSGAAAAASTATTPIDLPPTTTPTPSEPATPQQQQQQHGKSHYRIQGGIILTRAPLLTAEETPFESAFYFYQKRLNERLSMPFVTSVYFKPDTPALIDWNLKVRDREGTVAKELGVYHGRVVRGPHDGVSDDAEIIPVDEPVAARGAQEPRHRGGPAGDVARLDRALDRTLYLVVKGADGRWAFPAAATAKRVMDKTAGLDMNTWMVGRVPVAHHVVRPVLGEDGSLQKRGEKTFFLKARIMAGQANLAGNPFGYTEFKWLTAEELKASVDDKYYHSVRNMLADR
ncbi:50S ribosomal subunit L30 [Verticillium dahliae VdLs.17]|uniref:Large ribosomal subunit protein mL46 n=1 Tax=Verticillium dahliae (strain VdLs.17 / ATCC MYA-4575 / FGSC 10137) TaxID=498257 RepID=G2X7V4_VERDV|nr:50S ribosomal subunit L30 [Verticillium dahliae VdLs.17]EGY15072.1 50S ribosomal subunit L30 [Verticillium dahliae VdLs.17]